MAARYWVGGGSSANWNATGNTNWSDTSGGANNFSVPTSADDVIFDSAGNSNSTISATITILSLTITSGYTATMTHNAVLSLGSGGWTMNNTHTIAGSSAIALIGSTITITSNGQTWPNGINSTTLDKTITLVGDFTFNGAFVASTNIAAVWNRTTTETVYCKSITLTSNTRWSGTAAVVMTGGTLTTGASNGPIACNFTFAGNITLSGVIYLGSGGTTTITYSSGTITQTGAQLRPVGDVTFDTSAITWTSVYFQTPGCVISLTSDFYATSLTCAGAGNTFNGRVYITNLVMTSGTFNGIGSIRMSGGGTWSGTAGIVQINLFFEGDTTVSGAVLFDSATITYTAGTIITTGSTLTMSSTGTTTFNTNGMSWNNIAGASNVTPIYSITSTLTANTISLASNATSHTFSGAAGFVVGSLICSATAAQTITLAASVTYTVTTLLSAYLSRTGSILLFASSTNPTKAILTLYPGATCQCLASFTRIDASGGRPIRSFNGAITDCTNVVSFYDLKTRKAA
jgi:hypothetical protein